MEWIVSLLTLVFLFIFLFYLLIRKKKHDFTVLIPITMAFIVYHLGDLGLWCGWYYEIVRRIASVGFYFIIPCLLLIMHKLLPKTEKNWFVNIFSVILLLPWVYALIILAKSPLIYLDEPADENFVYLLVAAFVIAVIFIVIYGFRAAKIISDIYRKIIARNFSVSLIIMLILYLLLWGSIDAFGYDATYLFGFANLIFIFILWCTISKRKQLAE